ncbi:MAG: hypothetical protein ACKO3N_04180 [Verrucomicrobiota bacterium]
MALKVIIPGAVFTDTTLPILYPDPLIVPGSLMLIDFGRADTFALDQVPAHGAQLNNIAWEQAAAVVGGGSVATLSPAFENTFAGQPTMGLVERTIKKGLHVITSQAAMDSTGRRAGFVLPAAIRNHLHATVPSRGLYASLWGRYTRLATQGTDVVGLYAALTNPSANYAFLFYRGVAVVPDTGATNLGTSRLPASEGLNAWYAAGAQNGWVGSKPGASTDTELVFWFGARGAYESFQRNKAASGVFYRFYLEDLTASGRTFAQVDALDRALYNEAFGTGGRFAADAWTSPATIP